MNALILGGTRGIGRAVAKLLDEHGWDVVAYGRHHFDICAVGAKHIYTLKHDADTGGCYDAFVYCAGDVTVTGERAFAYPIWFYRLTTDYTHLWNNGCKIVVVSSVAVEKPARINPHYAAAKAALEHYALTVSGSDMAKKKHWRVEIVRFDLVGTDMLRQLPQPLDVSDRKYISAELAAAEIINRIDPNWLWVKE